MKGAREYANLFRTGQYGKLYITSGSHARGSTFRIQILPDNEKAEPNGENNQCLNGEAVTVYGTLGGQPGWTEYYGWIHSGEWQEDFYRLVVSKKNKIKENAIAFSKEVDKKEKSELFKTKNLLSNY